MSSGRPRLLRLAATVAYDTTVPARSRVAPTRAPRTGPADSAEGLSAAWSAAAAADDGCRAPDPTPPPVTTTTLAPAPATGEGVVTHGIVTYYAHPAGRCASPWIPFGTMVWITNPANGESVSCVVDDCETDTSRSVDLATATLRRDRPALPGGRRRRAELVSGSVDEVTH